MFKVIGRATLDAIYYIVMMPYKIVTILFVIGLGLYATVRYGLAFGKELFNRCWNVGKQTLKREAHWVKTGEV